MVSRNPPRCLRRFSDCSARRSAISRVVSAASPVHPRNVEQASSGAQEVTDNITVVSDMAGRTGEAADTTREMADRLAEQSENLRKQLGGFLDTIEKLLYTAKK
eukprot:NODE_7975_length_570_cov_1.216704_g7952_i0.p3 GENE.NODE_7975_length_570_cov_1.216704_g7952_i0~~NODE_7975_length_570_cov_1.216704_g7952_i0.p3  ORF type:complete len:104 (-),score=9.44 NODE_7975_length_570_cov_1.216704_g7952_i0:81-392(-)